MDYYDRAGLTPYLDKLGFNLVGYGCTTCIGNSGPLPDAGVAPRSTRPTSRWCSVLSGNRNFEGRINPDVKMNYLASPPLVVAYALAGTMDIDLTTEPLGTGTGRPAGVPARHLADRAAEVQRGRSTRAIASGDVHPRTTPTCSPATSGGGACRRPTGDTFAWDADSTYVRKPPVLRRHGRASRRRSPTSPAPGCWPSSATR